MRELDTDDILQKQVEQLEKEKRELQERLKSQEKKVDYFIRAKRVEEIPLLEQNSKEQSVKNREKWDQQEHDRVSILVLHMIQDRFCYARLNDYIHFAVHIHMSHVDVGCDDSVLSMMQPMLLYVTLNISYMMKLIIVATIVLSD